MDKKKLFCSSCRHSKYVVENGMRKLYCPQREAFGLRPYIATDCTDAEECLDFDPERWRESLTTRSAYLQAMSKCEIPLDEERTGLLSQEKLTP